MAKKNTSGNSTQTTKTPSKLYRSEKGRVIAGVCSGLGEFFQVDATIVRLIFILIAVFGGGGILLYLILWLIVPSEGSGSEITKENIEKNAGEIKDKAQQFAKDMKLNSTNLNSRQLFGVMILVFGLLLLLGNFGFMNFNSIMKFFPAIIVIIVGVAILNKRE